MNALKHNFEKMWGAHSMGVIWGEFIANNFTKQNKFKEIAGIHESNILFYFEKRVGTEFYFSTSEMEISSKLGKERFSKIDKAYEFIVKSEVALEKANKLYFETLQKDLTVLDSKETYELFMQQLECFNEIYAYYHACQPQYFTKIEEDIKDHIGRLDCKEDSIDLVSLLTSTGELDIIGQEELDWLYIVQKVQGKDMEFDQVILNEELMSLIQGHSDKYMALGSGEGGKPWDKEYYIELLKHDFNINVLDKIEYLKIKKEEILLQKESLINKHGISKEIVELSNSVGKIGNLRLNIRLGWMRLSHTSTNTLIALSTKNIHPYVSTDNIFDLTIKELENVVLNKKFDIDQGVILKRKEAFLFHVQDSNLNLYIGASAIGEKEILAPSVDSSGVREVTGSVARKGNVVGEVYVINWNEGDNLQKSMKHMKEGAVLVAGQTRPQLMPAIRKASAIVTDEGGITSHAAIVSRELGIPCIIGAKNATKVFKNGDMVEVDANTGIVRKIS